MNFADASKAKRANKQLFLEPNGLWVNNPLRGYEDERNNCFRKIQLVGQKYRDKNFS